MENFLDFGFVSLITGNLGILMVPTFLTIALYSVKKSELSLHALQNIAATLGVFVANSFVIFYFAEDITAFFYGLYDSLHVPQLDKSVWNGVPAILICLIAMVSKDFVDYWTHKLMHTPWGWPTHAAHHSDTHVNAFTSFRIHYLETLLMSLGYLAILTWMNVPEVFPWVFILYHLHNFYVHMDLDWDHGPFKYLIASPRYHRWHHADVPEAYGKNLANIMPIYDVIFGTYYVPGVCREKMGALSSGIADKNPVAIYMYPITEWSRMIRERVGKLLSRKTDAERGTDYPKSLQTDP